MSPTFDPNPYASPQTRSEAVIPSSGEDGSRSFRVRFFTIWTFGMLLLAVIGPLVFLPFALLNESSGIGCLAFLSVGSILGSPLGFYFLVVRYPIFVSDRSLRCTNFWGRYRVVSWVDVNDVRPIRFLNLQYFRIYGKGLARPLWLPFFMAKPKLFWPYLLTLIEPNSPLAKAVRDAGLAK